MHERLESPDRSAQPPPRPPRTRSYLYVAGQAGATHDNSQQSAGTKTLHCGKSKIMINTARPRPIYQVFVSASKAPNNVPALLVSSERSQGKTLDL